MAMRERRLRTARLVVDRSVPAIVLLVLLCLCGMALSHYRLHLHLVLPRESAHIPAANAVIRGDISSRKALSAAAEDVRAPLTTVYLRKFKDFHQPLNENLESSKWTPLVLNECTELMPDWYGPCLGKRTEALLYAEEIIYPDFEARIPGFVNDKDKLLWTAKFEQDFSQVKSNRRAVYDSAQDYIIYTGIRGQNLMFKNATFSQDIPTSWARNSQHCMGHMNVHASLGQPKSRQGMSLALAKAQSKSLIRAQVRSRVIASGATSAVDEALLVITPDAYSFQHWLDHAAKVLVQSAHLVGRTTRFVTATDALPVVKQLWGMWPHFGAEQVDYAKASRTLKAGRLIDSCRTPFQHPWLFFRFQEMVLGPDAVNTPMSQRKQVLYFSRDSLDPARQHGGRRILNEEQLLSAIRQLLQERGQGEELVLMTSDMFSSIQDTARFINSNARAIIGPHGGGLCNVKFAAKHTLVVEIMPSDWVNTHFYDESVGHALNYYTIIRDAGRNHDMEVHIDDVLRVLRLDLGNKPAKPILRWHYDWPNALEGEVAEEKPDIKCCS